MTWNSRADTSGRDQGRINFPRLVRQDRRGRIFQVKREAFERASQLARGVFLVGNLRRTDNEVPHSGPAQLIHHLSLFVIQITGAIFIVVGSLLAYVVVRFRQRDPNDDSEPAQVYGSTQIELAWTVIPILIVFVLFLTTASRAQSIFSSDLDAASVVPPTNSTAGAYSSKRRPWVVFFGSAVWWHSGVSTKKRRTTGRSSW